MTKDKSIYIKNIYYMLSYAFQALRQENYDEIASESFEDAQDLFAAILAKGVAKQLKQGLYREYIGKVESLPVLRGKLEMAGTIKHRLMRAQRLSCEFDELSENNVFNQILKTAMFYLVRDPSVKTDRKDSLKKNLVFFDPIDLLSLSEIPWNRLYFHRNSSDYELLMNLCYFVLQGQLQTTETGANRMLQFSDDHMARLYERFILEYFKQHHNELDDVKAGAVDWRVDKEFNANQSYLLPSMQTDIMLTKNENTLIIDAKYYGRTLQQQFDKHSIHSGNIYQIFTYVKNYDKQDSGNVSGMLLYAKTDEDITPDMQVKISGNVISARTLDLNCEFKELSRQLDSIVESWMNQQ